MSQIAVIDVETTGINPFRHNRIVEIAGFVVDTEGHILREFESLINPERDVGPTRIHGLTAADVVMAPRFVDILGLLVEFLEGCSGIAGHNVDFDLSFLQVEFERAGHSFPAVPKYCTMRLAGGGKLAACCAEYDLEFGDSAHLARNDARATVSLLSCLLSDLPHKKREIRNLPAVKWPEISKSDARLQTRSDSRTLQNETPSYLQKLVSRTGASSSIDPADAPIISYVALIDRIIEDRLIDESEGEQLIELAARWNLNGEQIKAIHREYVRGMAATALSDGILSPVERRDLEIVCRLLGVPPSGLDEALDLAQQNLAMGTSSKPQIHASPKSNDFVGKSVCFTGESQCCYGGEIISREMAAELATQRGIRVVDSVSKQLDILVLSDPQSQSGKAKKARSYGIQLIQEYVFWKSLDLEVS